MDHFMAEGMVTYELISLPCRRESYLPVKSISLQKGETPLIVYHFLAEGRVTCQ